MTELVTFRLRCPVCATEFGVEEVHGAVPSGRETDFRPVHTGRDPLLSNIHSCPRCRYSAYREGFETEPLEDDDLLEALEGDPLSLPRGQVVVPDDEEVADLRRYARSGELQGQLVRASSEPFGAVRYVLAARVREFLYEEEPLLHAHYYLRAAWAARVSRDQPLELRALREVLMRVSPVLEGVAANDPRRLRLSYLVGELSRRVGDFARAVDLLAVVEREADADDTEGAFLSALAQRQNTLAFVKSDVNALIPADLPGWWRRKPREEDDADDDGGESSLN